MPEKFRIQRWSREKTYQIDLETEGAIVFMCYMGNWIYMFPFVIEDYFAKYDKTCLNMLQKRGVVFEPLLL